MFLNFQQLPGDIDLSGTSFASIPTGIAALEKIPAAGIAQLFAFVGLLELGVMKDVTGEAEFVGDFRNGAVDFGWVSSSEGCNGMVTNNSDLNMELIHTGRVLARGTGSKARN